MKKSLEEQEENIRKDFTEKMQAIAQELSDSRTNETALIAQLADEKTKV